MGLISASVSMTQYLVEGRLEDPVLENVATALTQNAIKEIDKEAVEKSVGWTSFESPFAPSFESSAFNLGNYLVFSLRIDKKSVPNKMINKRMTQEETKRLIAKGRDFFSSQEKKQLKEQVINSLYSQIPATPNVYDIVWNYEEGTLWFFSNLKAANEALESFFKHSFRLTLIRIFPYTSADLTADLNGSEKDILNKLTPTRFYAE